MPFFRLIIFIFALCLLSAPSHAAEKFRLTLNWKPEHEFGGFYEAKRRGFYADRGIDLVIQPGGVGTPVIQMISSKRTDFGIVNADEVVIARDRGSQPVSIFATFQENPQGIMSHKERKHRHIAELFQGGKLALVRGTAYAAYLEKTYGFEKITVVPYLGGITQYLSDGSLAQQCYVTSEPLLAERTGRPANIFLISKSGFNPYATVVVVDEKFLEKKLDLVKAFVQASRRGWEAYLASPDETNRLLADLNPTLPRDLLHQMAVMQRDFILPKETPGPIGFQDTKRWEKLVAQLHELRFIKEPKPATTYFRSF